MLLGAWAVRVTLVLPPPCLCSLLILGCLWQTLGPERMCGSAQMGFRWSFTAPRQANGGTAARSHSLTKRKFRHEALIDETWFRQQRARGCDPLESLLIRGTKNQSYMNTLSTNGPWGSKWR